MYMWRRNLWLLAEIVFMFRTTGTDENEINMCNGDTKQGRDISLKFGQGLKTDCFCYIRWKTDSTPGVIDFHLLGMSLATTPCTHLGIYTGENVRTYDCNTTLTPYRYLANGTQTDNDAWVNIRNPPTTSGRIWMQINGSKNFTVSCNTNIITTSGQEGDAGIHSSKACFAPSGSCTFHRLDKCKSNQRIAIVDAYHTDNTECGMQGCPANMTSITESQKRKRLSVSKLAKVDEACTYKIQCRSQGQQGPSLQRFSVLKYKCIDDENEIGTCNGATKQGSDISLLFVPGSLQTSCTCFIRTVIDDPQVSFDVNLLGMSLPAEPCTYISILVDEEMLSLTCEVPVTPNRLLAFGRLERERDVKITIENPGTSKNIWIQITGTKELTVNCRSTGTRTPVAGQRSTTDAATTAENSKEETSDQGVDVDAVAGGVTVAVFVILILVLVLLWFRYKRNQSPKPTHSQMKKESMSDYGYATVADGVNPIGQEGQSHIEEDYDHIGDKRQKETGHYDTALLTAKTSHNKSFTGNEDDYNHLASIEESETIENRAYSRDYDTAASASKYVQKMRSTGVTNVDSDYDYNHIGNNPKTSPYQGDYDTTASASKAVAKMIATDE